MVRSSAAAGASALLLSPHIPSTLVTPQAILSDHETPSRIQSKFSFPALQLRAVLSHSSAIASPRVERTAILNKPCIRQQWFGTLQQRRRVCCWYEREEIIEEDEDGEDFSRRPTVGVFWDLDNKPPIGVPPYDAAMRLKTLASELGHVVEMVAYANRNAFTYVPGWVREERQERKLIDQLEIRGLANVDRSYLCKMCGRKCRTNVDLKRHFKQMHERERGKRMARLKTLKGKRREKFLSKVADKEFRYKDAASKVLVPRTGYGLGFELRRAGVEVITVESRPQAADEALMRHITTSINEGMECLCLVSDDSDFLGILRTAKSNGLHTVVVGDTPTLTRAADTSLSWEDVATGRMERWDQDDDDDGYSEAHRKGQSKIYEESEEEGYFSESDDDEQYLTRLRASLET